MAERGPPTPCRTGAVPAAAVRPPGGAPRCQAERCTPPAVPGAPPSPSSRAVPRTPAARALRELVRRRYRGEGPPPRGDRGGDGCRYVDEYGDGYRVPVRRRVRVRGRVRGRVPGTGTSTSTSPRSSSPVLGSGAGAPRAPSSPWSSLAQANFFHGPGLEGPPRCKRLAGSRRETATRSGASAQLRLGTMALPEHAHVDMGEGSPPMA